MNHSMYCSDKIDRRGYISKESILALVSQEEIFSLVFGFLPKEFDYVVNPLRKDKTPGCWFSYHTNGVLYFIDFGSRRTHSDCFNMVQDYFGLQNFYLVLEYIYKALIEGKKELQPVIIQEEKKYAEKEKVKVLIEARPFCKVDQTFWSQYGISSKQLTEDRVFAVRKYYALNTKNGNVVADCDDLGYSYNDFSNARKKLYFPLRKGKRKFLTNCTKNDIGGINTLVTYGRELIITKAYKDYRVLKNNGKNVVWFQNEGMIPSESIMKPLVQRFQKVLVWFDNDQAGISASEKIRDYINDLVPCKARNLWLPEKVLSCGIKDPSDCILRDRVLFHHFLKEFTV